MNLIIDIGNNFTKIGTSLSTNKIININIFRNNSIRIIDYINSINNIEKIIICTVGKENIELRQSISAQILNFTYTTSIPIKNLYKTPETLGLDRLAAIIGGNTLFPNKNLLIIDAGTALTIDFINSKTEYIGGNISPGLQMRYKSLNTFTEKLPLVSKNNEFNIIGNSTKTAIESGVQQGMVNEIDGYINHFKKNYKDLRVILTGGDGFFFEKNLKNSIFANSELVLLGLNNILLFND